MPIETEPLTRRGLLAGAAAGAAALTLLGRPRGAAGARPAALARGLAFDQGVAAGEPGPREITLWSRLADLERPARVEVEIARDPDFRSVLIRTDATALPEQGSTARVRLASGLLKPGEQYHYRFATRDADSSVGRFRTGRPRDSREPVRVAFFSCQEYIAGFYGAHRDLAARDDIDLVVYLGDYVYEQAFASTGSGIPPVRADTTAPDGETQTLEDYRRKYALYHSDPNLLAVRGAHALVAIWDDHEVEDNYADGLPGGATRNRRVPFAVRKANGYRAWYEAIPRLRGPARRELIYGALPLGAAELFLLDTRQYRDDQPCNPDDAAFSQPCPPAVLNDPGRTLLGAQQKRWLKAALARSRAPWKLVANQMMAMSLDAPPRNPLNTDAWDGYAAERRELIEFLGSAPVLDVAFLTGDIHTFFAGNVTRTGRQLVRGERTSLLDGPPRATEFVGSSISSPGLVDRLVASEAERVAAAAPGDALVLGNNPHIVYSNQAYKGYAVAEASPAELRVEYRAVRDARLAGSPSFTLRTFRVGRGSPYVEDLGGPLPRPAPPGPPSALPLAAPAALSLGATVS